MAAVDQHIYEVVATVLLRVVNADDVAKQENSGSNEGQKAHKMQQAAYRKQGQVPTYYMGLNSEGQQFIVNEVGRIHLISPVIESNQASLITVSICVSEKRLSKACVFNQVYRSEGVTTITNSNLEEFLSFFSLKMQYPTVPAAHCRMK